MSPRTKIIAITLAVFAGLLAYFSLNIDWDKRAIRSQFSGLIEVVEKDGPVSTFEALSRSRRLNGFFTASPSIEYFRGRSLPKDLEAISAGFLSAWGQIESASIRVLRHEIELRAGDSEARSLVTIRGRVVAGGQDRMRDTLDYQIFWKKQDGDWRIERIFPTG